MNVFARMRCSQALRLVPGRNWWNAAYALTDVSWTRSSASVGLRVMRRADMYNCPRKGTTSRSNRSVRSGDSPVRSSRAGDSSVSAMVAPLRSSLTHIDAARPRFGSGSWQLSLSEVSNPVVRLNPEGFLKIYLDWPRSEAGSLGSEVRDARARRRCARGTPVACHN